MLFNQHSRFEGTHAFLSASNYHWTNYTDEKFDQRYRTQMAAQLGTRLHAYAAEAIELRRYQPDDGDSLNMYVNDAIDLGMAAEQMLFVSNNCFGTADAISFDEEQSFLRIHDLKTGLVKCSVKQLQVYAAMFCLEYDVKPFSTRMEFRIYQNDQVLVYADEDPDDIVHIISKIRTFDPRIEVLRKERRR